MSLSRLPPIDERAFKILIDMHWCSKGWQDHVRASPQDFSYGLKAGILFKPRKVDHASVIRRLRTAVRATSREHVANGFVASLLSRRCDLRSALGSFANFQHVPVHRRQEASGYCALCGSAQDAHSDYEDLNVLNFERFKWGGVRHKQPHYAAFDLEQFAKMAPTFPTETEVEALRELLDAVASAPSKTNARLLGRQLPAWLRANGSERSALVESLGYCGVIGTEKYPGFTSHFVRMDARPDRCTEMPYPACWWKAEDGVCTEAVNYWFGHLLKS